MPDYNNALRFLCSLHLILIDSTLYLLPILFLCLIPTFFILMICFFSFIKNVYFWIFSNKRYGPNLKFLFFLFSPIPIILYFPIGISACVIFTFWILILGPIIEHTARSEDHYYDLSQTAALIYYLYHRLAGHDLVALNADNPELEERWSYLSESPVVAPFHTALQLSNGMWSLHTKLIPEFVIEDSKPHEPPIDFAFWRILVGALIFPFYGFVTIPVTIFVCVAFYIPILLRSEIVLWRAFWKLDRWCKFVSFLAILVATIALIPLIIAMDLLILGAVVLVSFYPMYQAVTESTAAGCQASLDVARQIIRRYMEVAVPGSARTSSIEGSEV